MVLYYYGLDVIIVVETRASPPDFAKYWPQLTSKMDPGQGKINTFSTLVVILRESTVQN
jgi:hypothetical protein